jgi:polar amino acid transport system substrate-binding protein
MQSHSGLYGGRRSILWLASFILLMPAIGAAQTIARVQQTGSINIGFFRDRSPFSSQSEQQGPRGYAVELCGYLADALKSKLRQPAIAVNYVATTSTNALGMVEKGTVDLLCGAVTETLQARQRVSFSIPIYVTGVGALVRKDAPPGLLRVLNGEVPHTGPTWRATINAGLANHVYAVLAGTTTEARVRERIATLGVIAKVMTVPSYEDGIKMVSLKQADAFFADRAVLTTYIARRQSGEPLILIDRRFTLEPVALAMQRGDEDFRLMVDTALSALYRSGRYVPVYARYFGEPSATAQMLFEAYALP